MKTIYLNRKVECVTVFNKMNSPTIKCTMVDTCTVAGICMTGHDLHKLCKMIGHTACIGVSEERCVNCGGYKGLLTVKE